VSARGKGPDRRWIAAAVAVMALMLAFRVLNYVVDLSLWYVSAGLIACGAAAFWGIEYLISRAYRHSTPPDDPAA
jgi:hypothetical protein